MKRTRVGQFVERLTAGEYRFPCRELARQPIIVMDYEIDIDELRRKCPGVALNASCLPAPPPEVAQRIGWTVYPPLEVEVDPWPEK